MIEGRIAQSEDIRAAAFVVGMATVALPRCGEWASTMKTRLGREISGDLLMTGETERALCAGIESLMTGHAVFREILMRRDQRSRHDHPLPIDRERGLLHEEHQTTHVNHDHGSLESRRIALRHQYR